MRIKLLTLVVAALFLLTGCGNDKTALPTKSLASPKNLGMTAEQFLTAYNELAIKRTRKELQIGVLKITVGEVKSAGQFEILPTLHFLCSVDNSTNLLQEVALIGEPKNFGEFLSLVESYEIIIDVLNPDLPSEQREHMLAEFKISRKYSQNLFVNPQDINVSTCQGNVKYSVMKNASQPFLFLASSKNI